MKLDDVQDEEDLSQGVVHRLNKGFAISKMREALFSPPGLQLNYGVPINLLHKRIKCSKIF